MKTRILLFLIFTGVIFPLHAQLYIPIGTTLSTSTNNNVGIGTSAPNAKLEVNGDTRINGNINIFNNTNKIVGFNDPANYYIGYFPVEGSAGLDLHYYGGIRFGDRTSNSVMQITNGKVGIGTTNPNSRLEVGVTHDFNQDEEMRIGSYYNSKFYGIGMNYRIDPNGNPSNHIIDYSGGTRYNAISLVGNKVGIGTTNPNSRLEVGVNHDFNQDEEMRIGSYYNSKFYGIGMNYRIDGNGSPSNHIIDYSGGARYNAISLVGNKVGIGTANPNSRLEVGVDHAINQDEEMRIGSYYNSKFYGIGMNYRIDVNGGPSNHIIDYSGGTRYNAISLVGNKVGIGTANPNSRLEVGVDHAINQDEEMRIGSYYNSKFYGIGMNYRIDANGGPSNHIIDYSGGTRYNAITLLNNKVGIGTANPDARLTVNGDIHATEVKVTQNVPADYVFEKYYLGQSSLKPDYTLLTLSEVEKFTEANHHLPNVPSAKEIKENGLLLGEMSNVLLQKVEELTLYAIDQQKTISKQTETIEKLKKENESFKKLEERLATIEKELEAKK
jgi:hypothetical protein